MGARFGSSPDKANFFRPNSFLFNPVLVSGQLFERKQTPLFSLTSVVALKTVGSMIRVQIITGDNK